MAHVLRSIASLVSIYAMLCFARIFLTWIPDLAYSQVGRVLSSICDPYLNLFRRLRFLRFASFDFSPTIALCVLIGISAILSNIALAGTITVGILLAVIVNMIWSIVSAITFFIIIILLVRLAILIFSQRYNPMWEQLDRSITPIVYKVSQLIAGGRRMSYKTALIISTVAVALIHFGLKILFGILIGLCGTLHF